MGDLKVLSLCALCKRQIAGEANESVEIVENSFECVLCFGLLDPNFVTEVAAHVEKELANLPYDASSFILALNLPVSQTLRETVIQKARPDLNGILIDVPYKLRNIDAYLAKLSQASGLRPTLASDLHLTITFENNEFDESDLKFLTEEFPNDFRQGKKRRFEKNAVPKAPECSKQQLQQVANRINPEMASKYELKRPTRPCTFSISFERDSVFVAGRYCKFSRSLPQSPWSSEDKGGYMEPGNSISEKVCDVLKSIFGAAETNFVASGREDIDVRMLGEGRPFVVELKNCRYTKPLMGTSYVQTLKDAENKMNEQKDVCIKYLTRVSKDQAEQLSVGQEEKKKSYTAYCYSTIPLSQKSFELACGQIPVEVIQKTPVRVLKRRALLDRPRSVYSLEMLRVDDHHFLARMETQAGTYIKEFVHGDFGRTRPSLADLLHVENGEVDILELDVERVDLEWPPVMSTPTVFR